MSTSRDLAYAVPWEELNNTGEEQAIYLQEPDSGPLTLREIVELFLQK